MSTDILQTAPKVRTTDLPRRVQAAVQSDPRIVRVVLYEDGWVPNAYGWPKYGTALTYHKRGGGWWAVTEGTYDQRRSSGRGPWLVGFSAAGGRLHSE
jgi:hypothetical protein